MKPSKEMIRLIESLHIMDREELDEMYGDLISDDSSEDMSEIKLELAYLIYDILCGKEPNEIERDKIYCYFQRLEMQDQLKAYKHSKSTQRIIRRLYRMQ